MEADEAELHPADLTRRLYVVESRCFALATLCEALIATHPAPGQLAAAWRDLQATTLRDVRKTVMKVGADPVTQQEYQVMLAEFRSVDELMR